MLNNLYALQYIGKRIFKSEQNIFQLHFLRIHLQNISQVIEKICEDNVIRFTTQIPYLLHIYIVLQCDLPPLRPHCGEAQGRDLNPGRAI